MGMTYTTTVTILFHVLYRSRQGDKAAPLLDKLRTSVRNKIMLLVLSWVTFLIYLPIGYPIVARCITYDKAKNDWDYSCDLPVNNVRAISQVRFHF